MLFDYLLLAQIDHRRAYNCEIMLSKVKVPLQDLMVRWFIFVYLSMKLRKKNMLQLSNHHCYSQCYY